MSKYFIAKSRRYIFITLTATIFSLIVYSKSFSQENVFVIDNVKVEGTINVNFSRDKYINRAFSNSFKMLMSKILLSRDLNKIKMVIIKKNYLYQWDRFLAIKTMKISHLKVH